MAPDVRAVLGHVEGEVAHDAHARGARVVVQAAPLREEQVLDALPEGDVLGELLARSGERVRAAQAQAVRPGVPGGAAMPVLEGHEEGVVVEPGRLSLAEAGELCRARLPKAPHGAPQHAEAAPVEGAVVNALGVVAPVHGRVLLVLEQPL